MTDNITDLITNSWIQCIHCPCIFCPTCYKSKYSWDTIETLCHEYKENISLNLKFRPLTLKGTVHSSLFYLFKPINNLFTKLNNFFKDDMYKEDLNLIGEWIKYTSIGINISFWLKTYLNLFTRDDEKVLICKIFVEWIDENVYNDNSTANMRLSNHYAFKSNDLIKILDKNKWMMRFKTFLSNPLFIKFPWKVEVMDYISVFKILLSKTVKVIDELNHL